MSRNHVLAYFSHLIEEKFGIQYSEAYDFQLEVRLKEVAKVMGLNGLEGLYHKSLCGFDSTDLTNICNGITINETSFFRDQQYFSVFETLIKTNRIEYNQLPEVSIWSAASSTGQEAVSLAIILHELKLQGVLTSNYKIKGTDVSDLAVKKAQKGIYTRLELDRGLSAHRREKYFGVLKNDLSIVNPEIKNHLKFEVMNLKVERYLHGPFQFVFCRNVLIYLNTALKAKIIDQIKETLAPGGYLFMGVGEGITPFNKGFQEVQMNTVKVFRKL